MKELKIIKLYLYFTVFQYSLIMNNIFMFVLYEKTIVLYSDRKEPLSEVWPLIQNGKFWIGSYLSEHFTNYSFVFIINIYYLTSQNFSYQCFLLLKANIQMPSALSQGNIHMAHKNGKTVHSRWNIRVVHELNTISSLYNVIHSSHGNMPGAGNSNKPDFMVFLSVSVSVIKHHHHTLFTIIQSFDAIYNLELLTVYISKIQINK